MQEERLMRINRLKLLLKIAELQLDKETLLDALGEAFYKRLRKRLYKELYRGDIIILSFQEAQLFIGLLGAEHAFAVMDFGDSLSLAIQARRAVFG